MKAFKNVKLITKNGVLENKAVVFEKTIISIIDDKDLDSNIESIDCGGNFLSPGFIDVHIHGCSGHDTMDDDDNTIFEISKSLVKTGVTSFLPTTMTMEFQHIEKTLERIKAAKKSTKYANILGCHLEGPFICQKYKGAQNEKYIIAPDFERIRPFSDIIKIVTIAPEVEGSIDFIKECCKNDIKVSIGHSNASFDEACRAIDAGASHTTHTFNAMTPLNHRNPGVVGAAMLKDVSCEIIADNIHVHPSAQQILFNMKGNNKIILITDAMRACLLSDGEYDLGGQLVYVRGKEARLSDGTIAGSVLTMNLAVKNFMKNTGINIFEAVNMASLNPAKFIGVEDRKGSIEVGKDSDFTIFDDKFNIISTYINGIKMFGGDM